MKKKFRKIRKILLVLPVFVGLGLFFVAFSLKMRIFYVSSDSMYPEIEKGSLVITRPKDNYFVGDVITYKSQETRSFVTHRIVEEKKAGDKYFFRTKGDNNLFVDNGYIEEKEIMGIILFDMFQFGKVFLGLIFFSISGFILGATLKNLRKEIRQRA